jgi:hypothetical protein
MDWVNETSAALWVASTDVDVEVRGAVEAVDEAELVGLLAPQAARMRDRTTAPAATPLRAW